MVVTARRLRLRVARSRCRGRPGAIEGDLRPGTDLQPACGTRRAVLKVTSLAGSGSLTVTVTVTV